MNDIYKNAKNRGSKHQDSRSIIDSIYNENKWQEGIAGNANIVQYHDGNIRGVAHIEDNALKQWIIVKHNQDLIFALTELFKTNNLV